MWTSRGQRAQVTAAYGHFGRAPYTENGMKFFEWENPADLSRYAKMNGVEIQAQLEGAPAWTVVRAPKYCTAQILFTPN